MLRKQILLIAIISLTTTRSFSQDTVYIYDIASQSLSFRLMPAYSANAVSDSTNPGFGSYGVTAMPGIPPVNTYPSSRISLIQNASDYYSTLNFPFTAVSLIKYGLNITAAVIGRRALLAFHFDVRQANSHWRSLADASPFFENGSIKYGFSKLTPVRYYMLNSPDKNPTYFSVIEVAENIGAYSGYFGLAFDTTVNIYDSLLLYNISYPNEGYPTFYSSPVNGDTLCMKYGYVNSGLNTFQAYLGGDGEYVSPFFDEQFRVRGIRWSFSENYFIGRKGFYYLKFVVDSLATDVEEMENSYDSYLSPNPASSTFTIHTSIQLQNGEIEIYNLLGKKVGSKQWAVGKKEIIIDVKDLSPGLYFVKLQTERGTAVQKLIIQ